MRKNIEIGLKAPDFTLVDTGENKICLSFFEGKKIILLTLIRGFA
jgi:peroxiredoxin